MDNSMIMLVKMENNDNKWVLFREMEKKDTCWETFLVRGPVGLFYLIQSFIILNK